MTYHVEVFVTLKPVVNDPAGLTIKGGLHALGFDSVTDVRAGKYLLVTLEADDEDQARARVEEMSRQLLANAVIEDYRVVLQPEPAVARAGSQISSPSAVGQSRIPSPSGGGQSRIPSPSGGGQGGGS